MLATMKGEMKRKYRLFCRKSGFFFCEDTTTRRQISLRTRDEDEALRLLNAKNESEYQCMFSKQIGRVYYMASDPQAVRRVWQNVMDEIVKTKSGPTKERWLTANKDEPFDVIRAVHF